MVMVRRHVGKEVVVTFKGEQVISSWTSVQIDDDLNRWLLRCYCDASSEHKPLSTGSGNLQVFNKGQWGSYNARLTIIGKPYTRDDAIVYEYAGVLEAENGE